MKSHKPRIVCIVLLISLCASLFVNASFASSSPGTGNGTGQGGDPNNVSGPNYWITSKHDGVRVTIVDPDTLHCSATINLVRYPVSETVFHFGNTNKLDYLYRGASIFTSLSQSTGENGLAVYYDSDLPPIVKYSNFQQVKRHFCIEGPIRDIVSRINENTPPSERYDYEELIESNMQLLIEPLMHVVIQGEEYILTPTEAAELSPLKVNDENFKYNLYWWFHREFPYSMFLERKVFDIDRWTGGTNNYATGEQVKNYLGLMAVSFQESDDDDQPGINYGHEVRRVTYNTNTDVITSVELSGKEIRDGTYSFACSAHSGVSKNNIYTIGDDADATTFVWTRWRTPPQPTKFIIDFEAEDGGKPDRITFIVTIKEASTKPEPPDPLADGSDKPSGNFSYQAPSVNPISNPVKWWTWDWEENKKYDPDDEESDEPEYIYTKTTYEAALEAGTVYIQPDEKVHTGTSTEMRSGYGINASVTPNITTNVPQADVTDVQHVIATFSEFNFSDYDRLLVKDGNSWRFTENIDHSRYKNPVHFIPVWYPNQTVYGVHFQLMDVWTPAGELSVEALADNITIIGSVYDDYFVRRTH